MALEQKQHWGGKIDTTNENHSLLTSEYYSTSVLWFSSVANNRAVKAHSLSCSSICVCKPRYFLQKAKTQKRSKTRAFCVTQNTHI